MNPFDTIKQLINKSTTTKLNDYLYIANRITKLPVDLWLVTKEQNVYNNKLVILCCNSYKNKVNNDRDIAQINICDNNIIKWDNDLKLNNTTKIEIEQFIIRHVSNINDYYLTKINRIELLSKL